MQKNIIRMAARLDKILKCDNKAQMQTDSRINKTYIKIKIKIKKQNTHILTIIKDIIENSRDMLFSTDD